MKYQHYFSSKLHSQDLTSKKIKFYLQTTIPCLTLGEIRVTKGPLPLAFAKNLRENGPLYTVIPMVPS